MSSNRIALLLSCSLWASSGGAQDLSVVQQAFSDVRLAACSIGDEVVAVGVVMEDQGPAGLGLLDGKAITITGDQLVAIGDDTVIILNGANIVEVLDGETRTGSCSMLNDALQAVVGSEKYAAAIDAAFAAALGEMSAEAQRKVSEKESILKAKQDRFQTRIDEFEAQQKLRVKKLDEREEALNSQAREIEIATVQLEEKGRAPETVQVQRELEMCELLSKTEKDRLQREIRILKDKLDEK